MPNALKESEFIIIDCLLMLGAIYLGYVAFSSASILRLYSLIFVYLTINLVLDMPICLLYAYKCT